MLDILERKSNEYQREFLPRAREYGLSRLEPLLDEVELRRWLNSRLGEECQPQPQERVPDEYLSWLEPPTWMNYLRGGNGNSKDVVIYETRSWVDKMRETGMMSYHSQIRQCLEDLVDNILSKDAEKSINELWSENGNTLSEYASNGLVIFYSLITLERTPILLLFAPSIGKPKEERLDELRAANYPLLSLIDSHFRNDIDLGSDEISPHATRAYPYYMPTDNDAWLAIQQEEASNLALSSEEERILRSISLPIEGRGSLPIFLNGRAGSGKSTMLYYIFSDYLSRKIKDNLEGDLLFLTYNDNLLKIAKDSVKKVLRTHHRYIGELDLNGYPDLFSEYWNRVFQPFRGFLLNSLPPQEQARFQLDKLITFHRFKKLFLGRGGNIHAKHILHNKPPNFSSPELCWYLIRAYIKGYGLDGYLEPDDYVDIPRDEVIVTEDDYEQIYETVFNAWYRRLSEEHGFWDDQDLIRRVIELDCLPSDYAVIFCDEAQDFTRLELQLIMQLCLFCKYDLSNTGYNSLPFAFAGDPFQTINPTGFRWEGIKRTFFDELILSFPEGRQHIRLNSQDLETNYRSTPAIVAFSNLVQYCREKLFRRECTPQKWWKAGDFPQPQLFIVGNNILEDEFKDMAANTVIIIPCEENQEIEFIRKDDMLNGMFHNPLSVPKNVFSPLDVKGLEFKRVVL